MKPFVALVTATLALFLIAGCGGGNGNSSSGGGGGNNGSVVTSIGVVNQAAGFPWAFQSPVTVKSGAKVQWVNNTDMEHGISWSAQDVSPNTSPAPPANVAIFQAGTTSATATMPTVTTQTTYPYICTVHGSAMPGEVIVTP